MSKSSVGIGTDFERYCEEILKENGFTVFRAPRSLRRFKNPATGTMMHRSFKIDILGCIDIIAKKRGFRTLWIQAAIKESPKKKAEKIVLIPWDDKVDTVQIWIKRKPGQIDVYKMIKDKPVLAGKWIKRKFYGKGGLGGI